MRARLDSGVTWSGFVLRRFSQEVLGIQVRSGQDEKDVNKY